ncbi:MAG: transglutaminase TgpA family protein [Terriglobales bacterium]
MRRTSEGLLLLLLATGFLMLAITGRLGWLVVMIGAAAYLIRGFTFLLRRPLLWSSRTWSLALLAYLPIFAWDGLVLSHSFLEASLHLVVLAGAARLFAPHSGRDDLLLGLLAFLEVLTAALLTVSGAFFILFLIFIVLLVATLVAFEMERAHAAAGCAPETVARIPRAGMLRFSLALSVMVAVCGALVFFLLPRTSLGGWSARPLGGGLTGFNDEVHLGAIANLQRSNRPIMHIRLIDSKPPLSPAAFEQIPWRGRGLTTFDGTRWFDPDTPAVFGSESGRIEVGVRAADGTAQLVRYQVSLEPIQSPVLFFPPRLLRAATHFPVLSWDRYTATLAGLGANGTGASYSGVSDLAVPSPQDLRLHGGWDRGHFPLRRYLQLPHDLDPRIPELARRVVAGVPDNNWERMQALTNYLKTHYAYSLQNLPQGAHPLSAFLFDPATGDCEYFASALAVMARTLDIPTRLVNGFLLGPYNPLTGEYLVRGRDAHTWVEAYFPTSYQGLRDGFGRAVWITFDATPDSAAATSLLPGSGMFLDAFSSAWQQWIVNYDWFRQARMAAFVQHDVDAAAGRAFTRTASAAEQAWSQLHTPSRSGAVWEFWASALLVVTICILGGLVLCRSGWALDGSRRRGRVGGDQAAVRRQAQAAYRRLLRHLQHCGLQHPPGQTPEELLAVVDGKHVPAELTVALAAFVRDYQALRFGSAPAGAARQLRPQLQHLRRLCRRSELT